MILLKYRYIEELNPFFIRDISCDGYMRNLCRNVYIEVSYLSLQLDIIQQQTFIILDI